jgi:hypothetical protein
MRSDGSSTISVLNDENKKHYLPKVQKYANFA